MFSFTVRRSISGVLEVCPQPPMSNDLFVVLDISNREGKVFAIGMDGGVKHWTEIKLDKEPCSPPTPEEVACAVCIDHLDKSIDAVMGKVQEAKKYDFGASMTALTAVQSWIEGRGSISDASSLVSQVLGQEVEIGRHNAYAVRSALRALVRRPVLDNVERLRRAL